jgi:broad specificity phosphatase PhoE
MGLLALVRHGQASANEANYDKLSPLGEEQARLLGELWKSRGVKFDRTVCGPRVRQRHTAEIACKTADLAQPELIESLDEMRIEPLFQKHLPLIYKRHPHLQVLGDAVIAADGDRARAATFARLFEATLQLWLQGQLAAEGVETWLQFQQRVRLTIEQVQSGARGKRIAIFTSAGVVAVALQLSTGMEDRLALDAAFRVRNSSFSEFLYSPGRFSLASFNETPHLPDAAKVTVR